MNFQEILCGPLGQRLAWTLLHFLWQGLFGYCGHGGCRLAAFACPDSCGRYAIALVGLVLMACCPLVTFSILSVSSPNAVALTPA